MREKITQRAVHGMIALLLSTGLVMSLLGILDRSFLSPRMILLSGAIILVFEAVSLHRISVVSAAGTMLAGLIAWLFGGGGIRTLSDFLIATTLRIRGIETALPLIPGQAKILVTAAVTLLCCFAVLLRMTYLPSMVLCFGVTLLVWLTDRMDLIPWLLPAFIAVLVMIVTARFDETPAVRVLPWAAGIVAAAFLIAGAGSELTPLKNKADEMRQAIMDRLFFTEARDVFSLYSVGYSPQGPEQLGGRPNPDDHPVMQVSTPKVTYLRGTVYDLYNGRAWKNTAGGRRYLWQSARLESIRSALFNQLIPPDAVQNTLNTPETLSVRMLKNSASTLFVPQRIRELSPGGEMVPYFSNSSEVFITRNLQAGDTYTVTAPLYSSEDPGIGLLLEACAAYDDPEWDNLPDIYTALPDHLESPLFDLANEITEHARTPYDKAIAIQNWLTRNFRYTLDVGEHPENIDFVTSFLLDTRKGYCTYFASAMTVLCRMAGLPARYVEGYLAVPNAQGEALVTGKDAHAWTEIYFKGFGWLTFDATPKQRMSNSQDGGEGTPEDDPAQNIPEKGPDTTPEPESIEPTQTPIPPENTDEPAIPEQDPAHNDDKQPDADRDEETPPDTEPVSSVSGTFPWWVLVLLVLIIAFGLRIVLTSPSVRASHTKSEEKKLEIWIQEIFDLLAAEHLTRRKGETPMGFTRRVDRLGYFSTVTTPVGECLSLIRYSRAEPVEADTCMVRDTAVLLRPDISRPAQVRYWVRRIFLPPKRRDWRKS